MENNFTFFWLALLLLTAYNTFVTLMTVVAASRSDKAEERLRQQFEQFEKEGITVEVQFDEPVTIDEFEFTIRPTTKSDAERPEGSNRTCGR